MPHQLPLISTLASAFGLALVMGFVAIRLKLPALVGYLLAGVLIGPHTPGFVADAELAGQLAEVGIMLLMFGVGLHFSLDDLLEVRKIAGPGALLQIVVATALGGGVAFSWGWSPGGALVFGLSLSVASTVVMLRALSSSLDSLNGRIAVGWLVVEDLAMVLVLVLLPPMAGWLGGQAPAQFNGAVWQQIGVTLLKAAAFIAFMLLAGRKLFPLLLWHVARVGSRELFTLGVVAAAVSIAYVAAHLFGVSYALGAFFAGMVLRESEFSHRAAEESLPLREAFAVLFFVSVGMLFDPFVLVQHPFEVLAVVGIIVFGKSVAAGLLVLGFRYPLSTALLVSASLAQIGEFSFILAALGVNLGLLPPHGQSLILAGALISITLNPLLFKLVDPIAKLVRSQSALARMLARVEDPLAELPMSTEDKYLAGQVVLMGYGSVGRRIGAIMSGQNIPFVVIERNRQLVESLRAQGMAAVSGDATDPMVLIQAHIAQAGMLVVASSDVVDVPKVIEISRKLNPDIEIMIRSHNENDVDLFRQEGRVGVFLGAEALAQTMGRHVLERFGKG